VGEVAGFKEKCLIGAADQLNLAAVVQSEELLDGVRRVELQLADRGRDISGCRSRAQTLEKGRALRPQWLETLKSTGATGDDPDTLYAASRRRTSVSIETSASLCT